MVTAVQVEFSKPSSAYKAVVKVVNAWEGEIVLFCDFVEATVVDAHAH